MERIQRSDDAGVMAVAQGGAAVPLTLGYDVEPFQGKLVAVNEAVGDGQTQ